MVDEGDAAVKAASTLTASGEAEAAADALEPEFEASGGTENSRGGRSASPPPCMGTDATQPGGSSQGSPSAGLAVGGALDDAPERRLVAGDLEAFICPPLWKVWMPEACPCR
jgi:hypothetical protein